MIEICVMFADDLNDNEITNIVGKTKETTPTVQTATTKNDIQKHLIAQKKELKNQTRLAVEQKFVVTPKG
jgi:hypothetical protein